MSEPTPQAMRAAKAIREIPLTVAEALIGLFKTTVEDKVECEEMIVRKIAETIDRHVGEIIPGEWECPKCQFSLSKRVLCVGDGEMYANNEPFNEPCPNDGTLMVPVTYKMAYKSLAKAFETQLQRAVLAEDRLKWLDLNCSFVADYDYTLGPFKRGELTKLADSGIEADKKKAQT